MSHLTIYQDNYTDSTVISNRFIDEYMKPANDAQLKIYLYLIRTMSAKLSTSVSDIADIFNYTEKDVLRALKYWEKNHLLTLDYDEAKNLTGIHMLDLNASASNSVPESDTSSPMCVVPISSKQSAIPNAALEEDPYKKPAYTLEQLKAFKSDETASRLLFITEQYLKKTLSANEMKTIFFISDKLGFSEDLVDHLIQYCVGRGRKELKYIEKVAIDWAQAGITTPEQAEHYAHKYDKIVYDVMRLLGRTGMPTQTEATYIDRWTKELSFDFDVISVACEKAVLAVDNHRFEYADKVLRNWYKAGIHYLSDIQAHEEKFKQNKAPKISSANKFNQFMHNQYDFDALEKELLSN